MRVAKRRIWAFMPFAQLILWLAIPQITAAANHYVRAGATGSACSDWGANACNVLPAKLIRGDTYYIAAGNYAPYEFSTAQSGTTVITIKKATVADHGTSIGWLDSYATGQAIFANSVNAQFYATTGYLILDGNPTNTKAATFGQGIKIDGSTCTNVNFCWTILLDAVGNVTLKGIEVVGMAGQPGTDPNYLDQNYRCISPLCVNNKIQLSYFHDSSSTFFQINNSSNFLLEDTWIDTNKGGTPTNHAESIAADGTSNVTIRRNVFFDIAGTGYIATGLNQGTDSNWNVYGNVFAIRSGNPNGSGVAFVFGNTGNSIFNNAVFVNNSIINVKYGLSARVYSVNGGTGNVSYNNLWYDCNISDASGFTSDYNYYILTAHNTEANQQTSPTSDPFVDWVNGNFRLSRPTNPGVTLSPPFDTDPAGRTRGTDGVWDRGAFEVSRPSPPTNLRIGP